MPIYRDRMLGGALVKKSRITENKARLRWIVTITTTALAALFCGMSLSMMLRQVPNMHIIFYLVLGCSILLVTLLAIWTLGAYEKHKRLAKILGRCYFICLALGIAGFLTLQGFILSGARTDATDAEYLIVLGAGLRNDGPSIVLRSRLNAAIAYLQSHGEIPIIVSGGLGRGESITEAEAMYRYLVARGVDESLIWKEEASTSTHENIAFSLAIMEEKGLDVESAKVAVVSNEFHLFRAKLIAGKAGLDASGVAATTPGVYLRTLYFSREAFALAAEVLLRG